MKMNKSLRDYFNGVSEIIAVKAKVAGLSAENTDIGANREIIFQEFLAKHIPKRLSVNLGGDIFGVGEKRSEQIDIIINHDISLTFEQNSKFLCPVESVTSAISVKSFLNKQELENSLRNLASIPQPEPAIIQLSPLKKTTNEYILWYPALFVFAYDGISLETCLQHLKTFYSTNNLGFNRIPRGIIVNGKYIITFIHYQVPNATVQTPFTESCMQYRIVVSEFRGFPLFWMMIELAKGLSWLDGMYLDYSQYYDEAFIKVTQSNVGNASQK